MAKYLLCVAFALAALISAPVAGETKPMDAASEEAMKNVLGPHAESSADLNAFMSQIQTPGMQEVVAKLAANMAVGPDGEIDMSAVNDYVRQNLTLEDAQKILGEDVDPEAFNKAMTKEVKPEDLEKMMILMQGGHAPAP